MLTTKIRLGSNSIEKINSKADYVPKKTREKENPVDRIIHRASETTALIEKVRDPRI